MLSHSLLDILLNFASPVSQGHFVRWLRHLGAAGLILVGIIDNSFVPLPGSMDVFVVLLAAGQHDWWPYYAFMGTVGSLVGGYLTYRIARREGKETLGKRLKPSQVEKVRDAFEKWGFLAISIPALIPPPFPMTPFLIAAGAAQYPRKQFIASLALGRGIRYTVLSLLAALYGREILAYLTQHSRVVIWFMIALVIVGVAILIFRLRHRSSKPAAKMHS